MKKLIIIIAIISCLIINSVAFAFDEWTQEDTKYQLTYTILHVVDWKQTRYIARHPEVYRENNLFLGKHPSVGQVNTYFASTLILHTGIAYCLPEKYRRVWQYIWIAREVTAVNNNFQIGIRINF